MGNSTPTNGLAGQAAGAVQNNPSFLSTAMKAVQDNPAILQMALGALQGSQQSNQLVPIGGGYMKRAGGDVSNILAGAGQGAMSGQLESILAKRKEDALMRELEAKTKAEGGLRKADNEAALDRQAKEWGYRATEQGKAFGQENAIIGKKNENERSILGEKNKFERELIEARRRAYLDEIENKRRIEEESYLDMAPFRFNEEMERRYIDETSPQNRALVESRKANTDYIRAQQMALEKKPVTAPLTPQQWEMRTKVQNEVARALADPNTGRPAALTKDDIENIDALIKSGVPPEKIIEQFTGKPVGDSAPNPLQWLENMK